MIYLLPGELSRAERRRKMAFDALCALASLAFMATVGMILFALPLYGCAMEAGWLE